MRGHFTHFNLQKFEFMLHHDWFFAVYYQFQKIRNRIIWELSKSWVIIDHKSLPFVGRVHMVIPLNDNNESMSYSCISLRQAVKLWGIKFDRHLIIHHLYGIITNKYVNFEKERKSCVEINQCLFKNNERMIWISWKT